MKKKAQDSISILHIRLLPAQSWYESRSKTNGDASMGTDLAVEAQKA